MRKQLPLVEILLCIRPPAKCFTSIIFVLITRLNTDNLLVSLCFLHLPLLSPPTLHPAPNPRMWPHRQHCQGCLAEWFLVERDLWGGTSRRSERGQGVSSLLLPALEPDNTVTAPHAATAPALLGYSLDPPGLSSHSGRIDTLPWFLSYCLRSIRRPAHSLLLTQADGVLFSAET